MIALYTVLYTYAKTLGVSIDYSGIGAILVAITALLALLLGHKNSRRSTKITDSVSYVDNNLKTMQATQNWLMVDNKRLREVNENQRELLVESEEKIQQLRLKLAKCKELCIRMSMRLATRIGNEDDAEKPSSK